MPSLPKRLELISLGDELLLGIRENTHLVYLGKRLTPLGLCVARNVVVRDNAEEIERQFRESWAQNDIVLTTGGLGPTRDDITRETISRVLQRPLVHVPKVESTIRERFERMGRPVTDNVLRQTFVPQGAEILENRFGTAPGIWLEVDGKILVMLPGPSNEMHPMVTHELIPRLRQAGIVKEKPAYLQLRTAGLGESLLEHTLNPVFDRHKDTVSAAFCAHGGLVDVRLSPVTGDIPTETIDAVGEECRELLGEDFVCFRDISLAALILEKLRVFGKTMAVAESCTGGMLASAFCDVPGASKVFQGGITCYTNSAKTSLLDIPEAIILQHGAVSAECAVALATGAAEKLEADYALSVTGFAGPGGGNHENPVGTIYIGYSSPVGAWAHKHVFTGSRMDVRQRAVASALDWMRRKLTRYELEEVLNCFMI